ncbi:MULTISPECIES: DUF4232 domain-containing protein [unclassified Streptomyces]|uniref:DUF4232 domain-containing protein n=1 Tax=unclassified Streptomyces TaxID=2593676 RepID=UPI0033D5A2D9
MSARTIRTRTLAAAALTIAALTLTACNGAEGVRDEGASKASTSTPAPKTDEKAPADKGQSTVPAGAKNTAGGTTNAKGSTGSSNSSNSSGTSNSSGSKASGKSKKPAATPTCSSVRTTATVVSRPLNHLLLTVTNTGSKNCNVIGYPAVRFGEAQSVPPAFEDSKPQAVVTLAPGESGYAGVQLSAADGSGSNGYTAKSLAVYVNQGSGTASNPSLPAKGVYVDDSITVTYWQQTMADALAW